MGLSAKPHRLDIKFEYTYSEQSKIVEQTIIQLGLKQITFLSSDHGGATGFGALAKQLLRFKRVIIANSWAWLCGDYRASKLWSMFAPRSTHFLRWLMINKQPWLIEIQEDLRDERVWHFILVD